MRESQGQDYRKNGLTEAQAERSRREYGENRLEKKKKKGFFRVFLSGFSDPIIRILLGAVCANLLFTRGHADLLETGGILAAVLIATTVSALSERGSERAFEALQQESGDLICRVRREGRLRAIPAEEVVVGDLLCLAAGEKLPADGILLKGELRVDQSALNGESTEAAKRPGRESSREKDPGEGNRLFQGSTVCSGEGELCVTSVGGATLYGQIAREVQEESPDSPMKLRLARLASAVSKMGYLAAALVILVTFSAALFAEPYRLGEGGWIWKKLLEAFTMGITILVVAVPEGLPMMITVVLSSNMKRMMKDKVLVRKAVGIETAGSLNLLLTDKTGTLTQGKMTLEGMILGDGSYLGLSQLKKQNALWKRLCLSAFFDTAAQVNSDGTVFGSTATDRAILEAVLPMARYPQQSLQEKLPFTGERKYSAAWLSDGTVFVKGAPERLFSRLDGCMDREGNRQREFRAEAVKRAWKEQAEQGARIVLAAEGKGGIPGKQLPASLSFLGLLVLSDPLRPEAREAVGRIHGAGVGVVMVTGDNKDTASSIARSCGILKKGEEGVLTGDQLDSLSDEELKAHLPRLRVVARAVPSHKSRLVRLWQEQGKVVGMTGDGINDAAALKQADVGFAMGSGSEIAKEAGDIVITDDRFASLVKAVLYGRTLFKSIRKFIMFQLTMNICAVGLSLLGPLLGVGRPITVLQMLWVNIIMDTLGGIAFAAEGAMESYLREPPKRRDEPILNRSMVQRILAAGLSTLGICLFFLKSEAVRTYYDYYSDHALFYTAFFVMFIFAGIFNCFTMRSPRLHILSGLRKNRLFIPVMLFIAAVQLLFVYWGGPLLRTVPLSISQLGLSIGISALVLPVNLLFMAFHRLSGGKGSL